MAGTCRLADGRRIGEAPSEGRVIDALRRALELPTAPPAQPTSTLFTALWLHDIIGHVLALRPRGTRRVSWAVVAKMHPAMRLLALADEPADIDQLVPAARALARVMTWERVRDEVTHRHWLEPLVSPAIGAWMDEGMLARELLGGLLPRDQALDRTRRLVRADVADRLDIALAAIEADPPG